MLMWIILADDMTATAPKWFTIGNDFRNDCIGDVPYVTLKMEVLVPINVEINLNLYKEDDTKQSKSEMKRIEPTAWT